MGKMWKRLWHLHKKGIHMLDLNLTTLWVLNLCFSLLNHWMPTEACNPLTSPSSTWKHKHNTNFGLNQNLNLICSSIIVYWHGSIVTVHVRYISITFNFVCRWFRALVVLKSNIFQLWAFCKDMWTSQVKVCNSCQNTVCSLGTKTIQMNLH